MAVCEDLIISATTVKETVALPDDLSDDRLAPSVRVAHDQLRRTLGRTLYDAVLAAVVADPTLDGSDYETLVEEYVCKYVAWWAYWHALPRLNTYVTVTGVQKKSGGDFQAASAQDLSALRKSAKDSWEMYYRAMMDYLRDDDTPAAVRDKFETTTDLDDRNNAENDGGIILGGGPASMRRPFEYGTRRSLLNDDCCDDTP